MNSKQLLLTTALITSLSSIAIADVSISGSTKISSQSGDYAIEVDVFSEIGLGKHSIFTHIGVDNANTIEQLYLDSNFSKFDLRVGAWKNKSDELGRRFTGNYRLRFYKQIDGIDFYYEDRTGSNGDLASVSGEIYGVNFEHKMGDILQGWGGLPSAENETKLSGSISGINYDFHKKDFDVGSSHTSATLTTNIKGVALTYVDINAPQGTNSDGFVGKYTSGTLVEANAFGLSTSIFGNKFTYKDIYFNDGSHHDIQKFIFTKDIASGATVKTTSLFDSDEGYVDTKLELDFKF